MLLKGNVSVIVELGKTEWEAKPVGVAFGNWFFGVLVYQKRAAEHLRAPAEPAIELLCRLRDWDHLPATADGSYWIKEIDAVLRAAGRG